MADFQIGDLVSFPQRPEHYGISGEGKIKDIGETMVTIDMTKIYDDLQGNLHKQDLKRNPVEWLALKETLCRVGPLSYIEIFRMELMKDHG